MTKLGDINNETEVYVKSEVDGLISSLPSVAKNLTKEGLIAGEAMSALQAYHSYRYGNQTTATAKKIGDLFNTKVAFKNFKGSGLNGNTFKTFLSKTGTPTVDLKFRLETDNAGKPSGTLIDVNAYGSISQASLTTSLVQTTLTLNGSISTSLNNIWLVLYTDTPDNTNYYNIGVGTGDEFSSYIYYGSDWVNEGTGLNETLGPYGGSYSSSGLIVEYFFTPSVKGILKTVDAEQGSSLQLIRVSDSVVIGNGSYSGGIYTFNLAIQSGIQYKLKHTAITSIARGSNGTLPIPATKTNFILNSIYINGVLATSNRWEQMSAIQIAPNSTSIKNENININTNIFQLDLNRISKANDTARLKVDGIVNNNVIQYGTFLGSFGGIVGGFTGLLTGHNIGDLIYLGNDGFISMTAGTNSVIIGKIFSDTEIELTQRINGETSITATTGSVVLGNAVGFITQNIPGVGNVKIPYWNT